MRGAVQHEHQGSPLRRHSQLNLSLSLIHPPLPQTLLSDLRRDAAAWDAVADAEAATRADAAAAAVRARGGWASTAGRPPPVTPSRGGQAPGPLQPPPSPPPTPPAPLLSPAAWEAAAEADAAARWQAAAEVAAEASARRRYRRGPAGGAGPPQSSSWGGPADGTRAQPVWVEVGPAPRRPAERPPSQPLPRARARPQPVRAPPPPPDNTGGGGYPPPPPPRPPVPSRPTARPPLPADPAGPAILDPRLRLQYRVSGVLGLARAIEAAAVEREGGDEGRRRPELRGRRLRRVEAPPPNVQSAREQQRQQQAQQAQQGGRWATGSDGW